MSETAAGLLFLIVAGMVAIGLLVLLFRILTSRLFLNLSTLLALAFLGFLAVLIGWGG
ncbi:MAG: hypothetical protein JJ869_19935 [Marivita sp.]|uniref:hypothetical protein n=1 Tax=Marivita sp. TaxID=2003365 RepID=UPI001B25DEF8|nr:hypothetical protein [Marivita sp.]MBO6885824.1 hypothetical protein [Marivita sp.]